MKLLLALPTAAVTMFFYVEGTILGFINQGFGQGVLHALVPLIAIQHGLGHSYGFWP